MAQICLSVVIPVYNSEKYLSDCIFSVENQTIKNYEIILVDDGSSDNSRYICDSFSEKYPNIRVFHQSNQGVSAARNFGIKRAIGKYIAFIDADDMIEPTYFQKLIHEMSSGGLVACPIGAASDNMRIRALTRTDAQRSLFIKSGMQGFPVCKMFDLKLIKQQGIYFQEDIAICEDLLFVAEYLSKTYGALVWISPCGYFYRENPEGALEGRFQKRLFQEKHLTEYKALCRIEKYISSAPSVKQAWELRKAKAAVTCIRTMLAADCVDSGSYEALHKEIRSKCLDYLRFEEAAISSKISVALSAISPKLEYWVWKTEKIIRK